MKLHFVGIGGSGISGVAHLAEKLGFEVSGCDLEANSAYGNNITQGHSTSHVGGVDQVIVSPALLYQNSDNPEIIEAKKQNKLITWQEFIGKTLVKDKKVICVAGTHGKSTTTAMAGKLLEDSGFDPLVVIGANVLEWNGNYRFGKGKYFVIEADEFNNNFLNYSPEIVILNNIEFDHPDFFKSEEEVFNSFRKFVGRLVGEKILIYNADSIGVQKLLSIIDSSTLKLIPYSLKHAKVDFLLKVPGVHNISNALGVVELGRVLGIKDELIKSSLENFSGIGRRMELIADKNGIKVYDDYAHHPTAIKTTLEGIREKYLDAKILVIDEPHGYKRTKALLTEYKGVFDSADKVIIGPIFQARDEVDKSITPQKVAEASGHKDAVGFNSFDEIIGKWKMVNDKYDVVVVMGAGKSYLWAREIAKIVDPKFSNLTSFRVGGKIKKYFEVKTEKEIDNAIKYAKENSLPLFVIGGGTDILVSDKDFDGVVIKFTGDNLKWNVGENEITAQAGMPWDKLVEYSVERNLQGVECLSGIPGTVGASPVQNIGAYGQELADTFVKLIAYNIKTRKFETFNKKDCKFGYRESIFKEKSHWQKYIICSVTLELVKNGKSKAEYESLKKYINSKNPTLLEIRNAVQKVRVERLENPEEVGNAGSFFKNPIITSSEKSKLELKFPNIKIYPFEDRFKIPAAWLVENAGWKGKTYKDAGVSTKHALVLINKTGHASAKEIYDLSQRIIDDVNKKFGVKLEREVQLINF